MNIKTETPKRLQPLPSTTKHLFARSGNMCAMPTCENLLFKKSGAFVGKIAHIKAASMGGPRFDPSMSNEQRRDFANLLLVCGNCHDEIDDKHLVKNFSVQKLVGIKKNHEAKFEEPELAILRTIKDWTALADPTYPKTLEALSVVLGATILAENEEEIEDVKEFVNKLRHVGRETRIFAKAIAKRVVQRGISSPHFSHGVSLPVDDITTSLEINSTYLKKHAALLDSHYLGWVEEDENGGWQLTLSDSRNGSNPWTDMVEFSKATGIDIDELLFDLNFALYDDTNLVKTL